MDLPTELLHTVDFAFPMQWLRRRVFERQDFSNRTSAFTNLSEWFFVKPITYAPQWHYFPVCWSYPDFNINGLDKSEKNRSERDTACYVENMHCWGFTLFFILFYFFKRYNAQFVFILIHTLHNVFIGRFSSPPTALGRTSIRPARHDHVWGFFSFQNAPYNL